MQTASKGTQVELRDLIVLRREASRLDLATRGKLLATRSGGHLSRFRGRGMEFDESRVYQAGDDPRHMDWRVTARTGQAHVKLFSEERERPVWLLLDQGPSMQFGSRVAFKSVLAAQAGALLAWAAVDQGDRVGGLVFDQARRVEHRPLARAAGLLPLLKSLADLQSRSRQQGFAGLNQAAEHLLRLVKPGSLVMMLSDFANASQASSAWLSRLARANELVLVHIYDPLEAHVPPRGRYAVTDGQAHALLDTADRAVCQQWSERFAARSDLLRELSIRHQAHLIELRTDQPVGDTLHEGLRGRSVMRRGGR